MYQENGWKGIIGPVKNADDGLGKLWNLNTDQVIANPKPTGKATNRMAAIGRGEKMEVWFMIQSIEETHSPTTTISGASWGVTMMGS